MNQVNEVVVGGLQLAFGGAVEDAAGSDELLEHGITVCLRGSATVGLALFGTGSGVGEEGCDVRSDGRALALCAVEVSRKLEREFLKVTLHEGKLRYTRHGEDVDRGKRRVVSKCNRKSRGRGGEIARG